MVATAGSVAAARDISSSSGGAQSRPSQRASRSARQRAARQADDGRLQSAYKCIRALELQLALAHRPGVDEAMSQSQWSPEMLSRLLAIAPALEAQLEAADAGLPSHSSSSILPPD